MYERFTDRARKVFLLANEAARDMNHEYIGTEHMLLGLVKVGNRAAVLLAKSASVQMKTTGSGG